MTVGERIKHYRSKSGLTQLDVANAIGTTKQAIYKYENNIVTNIPTEKIMALANLFGISPVELAGWEENKKPVAASDELWAAICADERKLKFAQYIITLSDDDLDRIERLLDAALLPPIPESDQVDRD